MRRIEINMDLADVDDDGVFQNQTLGGAGNFTLNGAGVTSGEWVTPDLFAKKIGFTSTGNISGVNFTVSGYQDKNKTIAISETIAGPNNNTVETTNYFYSIQSISANGAVGTNTKAGPVDEAISQIIPIKRDSWKSSVVEYDNAIKKNFNESFKKFWGFYKNNFWNKKEYN